MTINALQGKSLLDGFLGSSTSHKNNECSYQCPFCNHYKKKLQVSLLTQKWHCWVCNAKGQTIVSLLRKSSAPYELVEKAKKLYKDNTITTPSNSKELTTLPPHYRPLYIKQNSPEYKNALHYAMTVRKLTAIDILRYQVGYCDKGPYAGMIIIPSYSDTNMLNYYVGRSYYKTGITHKNPPVSKDIVGFENQINWNEPITIVEGAFDAIAVKRNSIPLFGKKILPMLRSKILTKKVKQIYVALDADAYADSVRELEYFLNNGIEMHMVNLPDKDPSTIGYSGMVNIIASSKKINFLDLIKYKMAL